MKRAKLISVLSSIVGILMISMGIILNDTDTLNSINLNTEEFNINNLATSANAYLKNDSTSIEKESRGNLLVADTDLNVASAGVYRTEVFDGLTMDELSAKLNRVLGGTLAGKGELIANTCISLGVDPYITVAIMIHETGNGTSGISISCNNFGGQKGSGCGSYQAYATPDEGITGMINNLYCNFYSKGLNTVETIGPRYAESNTWVSKINAYVAKIRAS